MRDSILVCFYYSYCQEGNSDCTRRTIAKFNVGTSQWLLRRQSTCHSSFNGIQASSECDEAQDHNIWEDRRSSTTIWQRQGAASLGLKSTFDGCNCAKARHRIIQKPSCASTWRAVTLWTHLPWHNFVLILSGGAWARGTNNSSTP